jgi:predicted Zn-dependent protease
VEDAAIETSLRAAIRLNAGFAPAYDALATFYGMRHERLDEAETLSAKAVELEPGSLGYRLDEAEVLAEERKLAKAMGELKAAQRLAKTPNEIAAVEGRIRRLEEFQRR